MATNNFKPFAIGNGANVTSQNEYEQLDALLAGFQAGKASSAQINKALRQSSVMAHVLAQFISDSAGVDVLDNGIPEDILTSLKAGMVSLTSGRLINVQVLVSSGTYPPTPGTKKAIVEMVGGGGASGGTPASSSGSNFASGGAGSGAYIKFVLDNPVETQVTIGKGGVVSGGTGLSGGATSFGDIATVGGGGGSAYAQASGGALLAIGGNGGGAISATGRRIVAAVQGERGGSAVMINGGAGTGNNGASSPFGRGGTGSGNGNGGTPTGYGSGAGGAMRGTNNTGQPSVGAAGADGLIVVWEYS